MANPRDSQPILRIRRPGDLLEAIPYLLGFHPSESLVLVGLRNSRVQVTARVDLLELAPEENAERTRQLLQTLGRAEVSEVIAAVFTGQEPVRTSTDALPFAELIEQLALELVGHALFLADALLVVGNRWWSYVCGDADCCPPTGTLLSGAASEPAAAATYAGLVALADRESVEALLAADPSAGRLAGALAAAEEVAARAVLDGTAVTWRRTETRVLFAAARAHDRAASAAGLDGGMRALAGQPASRTVQDGMLRDGMLQDGTLQDGTLQDGALARLGVALTDVGVRDSAWRAIERGRLDGWPLWQRLGTGLPSPYDAAPLFLFGWAAWRRGSGALAAIAAERALRSDPGYRAAEMLAGLLRQGLDPFRTPKLVRRRSA